jgi:hypothetical protein
LLSAIGITQLRQVQPGLTGEGVAVVLAEATSYSETFPGSGERVSDNNFEADPSTTRGIPTLYINATGEMATSFPNAVGTTSGHAWAVGELFFGASGVSPGVSGVISVQADYFVRKIVWKGQNVNAKVVNQSFGTVRESKERDFYEQKYDNYVAQYRQIIVSGAGNGGEVIVPGSFMNGIAAGAFGGDTSTGPVADGRSKPDVVVPAGATSFSSPIVSGVTTVLVQAGQSEMGGAGTAANATDPLAVKALLLTGAIKPVGWTHTESAVLDPRHGAGIVNAYASYRVLVGGKSYATASTHTDAPGGPHDAVNGGPEHGPRGWNLETLWDADESADAVDHYVLDLSGNNGMAFTATLTWLRPVSESVARGDEEYTLSGINNLDLYLYDASTNTRVAASTSLVDNVEHVFVPVLRAGRYDLQVLKHGGVPGDAGWVSPAETYGLAWQANLLGDANLDGVVDAFDLNVLASNWQAGGRLWTEGDFTADGVVDAFDLNALAGNWQRSDGGSLEAALAAHPLLRAAAVPEPASLGALGTGAAGLLMRRRRN